MTRVITYGTFDLFHEGHYQLRKTRFADEIIIEEAQGQKFSDIKKYHVDIFIAGSD